MDEIKLRFEIFSENLKLIRSTNRKGLPYTLAVNRKFLPFLLFLKLDSAVRSDGSADLRAVGRCDCREYCILLTF